MNIVELAGYVPAIIFPSATLLQLWHLLKTRSAEGVSAIAWLCFAMGNVSMFIYMEKYDQLQSIMSLLFTAVLQIFIIALVFKYNQRDQADAKSSQPLASTAS